MLIQIVYLMISLEVEAYKKKKWNASVSHSTQLCFPFFSWMLGDATFPLHLRCAERS